MTLLYSGYLSVLKLCARHQGVRVVCEAVGCDLARGWESHGEHHDGMISEVVMSESNFLNSHTSYIELRVLSGFWCFFWSAITMLVRYVGM